MEKLKRLLQNVSENETVRLVAKATVAVLAVVGATVVIVGLVVAIENNTPGFAERSMAQHEEKMRNDPEFRESNIAEMQAIVDEINGDIERAKALR